MNIPFTGTARARRKRTYRAHRSLWSRIEPLLFLGAILLFIVTLYAAFSFRGRTAPPAEPTAQELRAPASQTGLKLDRQLGDSRP